MRKPNQLEEQIRQYLLLICEAELLKTIAVLEGNFGLANSYRTNIRHSITRINELKEVLYGNNPNR